MTGSVKKRKGKEAEGEEKREERKWREEKKKKIGKGGRGGNGEYMVYRVKGEGWRVNGCVVQQHYSCSVCSYPISQGPEESSPFRSEENWNFLRSTSPLLKRNCCSCTMHEPQSDKVTKPLIKKKKNRKFSLRGNLENKVSVRRLPRVSCRSDFINDSVLGKK